MVDSETVNLTLAANAVGRANVKYTCPDGYTPIIAVTMAPSWQVVATICTFTNNNVAINYCTTFPAESTASVYAKILCVKNYTFPAQGI